VPFLSPTTTNLTERVKTPEDEEREILSKQAGRHMHSKHAPDAFP